MYYNSLHKTECNHAQRKCPKNSLNVSSRNKYSAEWILVPPYNRDRSDNALVRWPIFTENDNGGEIVDEVVEAEMLLLA